MISRPMSHQAYREDIACTFGLLEIQVPQHACFSTEKNIKVVRARPAPLPDAYALCSYTVVIEISCVAF